MPDLFLLTSDNQNFHMPSCLQRLYVVHISDRFIRTVDMTLPNTGTEQFILSQNVTKNMLLVEKITWPQRLNVIVTITFD
jgi:uncharacterized membrane protein